MRQPSPPRPTEPRRDVRPGLGRPSLRLPHVLDGKASQIEVYVKAAQDAVVSALNDLNACVLAYGQTGSGKTHTTFGEWHDRGGGGVRAALAPARGDGGGTRAAVGAAAERGRRAARARVLSVRSVPGACRRPSAVGRLCRFTTNTSPTSVRRAGDAPRGRGGAPFRSSVRPTSTCTLDDALCMLRAGELHKRVAATAMNDASSRAHTIFLLSLTQARADDAVTSSLALVDLAGSEQLKQSRAVGQQRNEAVAINSSLLVLGKVIRALSEGQRHVPYHECKLTKLLRGAFGGASRTTAIVTCSSDDAHADNTVSSLRFGERCSTVTNTLNVARVSRAEAIATVDGALAQTEASLRSYEARGRTALPAYSTLKARHASLSMRRRQLGA